MSRYDDIGTRSVALTEPTQLPAIDWSSVGQSAPSPVAVTYGGPSQSLPRADALVMTWTSAEWAAMDHVFLRSAQAQSPSAALPSPSSWYLYDKGAPTSGSGANRLWGYYQLVRIAGADSTSRTVLLFKSDAHLAHPPYLAGLTQEFRDVVADVQPSRVYSIGTAGGATDLQNLGDVAVTNSAMCRLTLSENSASPENGKTFVCSDFFPSLTGLLPQVQQKLFFKLSGVATTAAWQRIFDEAKRDSRNASLGPYSLADLMNGPIEPQNLGEPKAVGFKGTPLLTTDTYFIAPGNSPGYAALEMDDAVIAAAALQLGIPFAFIRNISDAVIAQKDLKGAPIVDAARQAWSSAQYDHFGVYSSFNGALAAWATLADW
jgi:nucleoside phosphorylase